MNLTTKFRCNRHIPTELSVKSLTLRVGGWHLKVPSKNGIIYPIPSPNI